MTHQTRTDWKGRSAMNACERMHRFGPVHPMPTATWLERLRAWWRA